MRKRNKTLLVLMPLVRFELLVSIYFSGGGEGLASNCLNFYSLRKLLFKFLMASAVSLFHHKVLFACFIYIFLLFTYRLTFIFKLQLSFFVSSDASLLFISPFPLLFSLANINNGIELLPFVGVILTIWNLACIIILIGFAHNFTISHLFLHLHAHLPSPFS